MYEYFYQEGSLLSQKVSTTGEQTIEYWFIYDETGNVLGFTIGNTAYYYIRNLQGDVEAITDSNGNIVVNYLYNTWGKLISINDISGSNIGTNNPIRYRGYYYDTETGLYYVSSRYYDPEICRFINADSVAVLGVEQGSYVQYNLFAYCLNNPVNLSDPSGYLTMNAQLLIGTVAIVGVSVALGFFVGGAALMGMAIGSVAGMAILGAYGYSKAGVDGLYAGAFAGSMLGAVIGYMSGSIYAWAKGVPAVGRVNLNDGLGTYGNQGGHHPMAKKAFEGVNGYDPNSAVTINNAKLESFGVRHATITGQQKSLYTAYAKTGQQLTMDAMRQIEIQSMTNSGVPLNYATNAVDKAIADLLSSGVTQPVRIPWG